MLGENQLKKTWLNDFKIALIKRDFDKVIKLYLSMPNFDSLEEKSQALVLLKEAISNLSEEKENLLLLMEEIRSKRKALDYLSLDNDICSFDIKS